MASRGGRHNAALRSSLGALNLGRWAFPLSWTTSVSHTLQLHASSTSKGPGGQSMHHNRSNPGASRTTAAWTQGHPRTPPPQSLLAAGRSPDLRFLQLESIERRSSSPNPSSLAAPSEPIPQCVAAHIRTDPHVRASHIRVQTTGGVFPGSHSYSVYERRLPWRGHLD